MYKTTFKIFLSVLSILLIPIIAMQFTDEINWGFIDFVVMGLLLFTTGLGLVLVSKKASKKWRGLLSVILVLAFLLVWAELAVGVFSKL